MLSSCAVKPPVQEMSDARSAIQAAHDLPGDEGQADLQLKSAEQALKDAASAMRREHYEHARRKALEAKRHAQQAAKLKQGHHK